MSGVLRLSNNVTGRSTIIASASNDQTYTLPTLGGTLVTGGASSEIIFPPGTEALPGLHVQGDTDTGLYAPAANTLGISTGGNERLRIDSSGNVGVGTTSPTDHGGYGGTLEISGSPGGALYLKSSSDVGQLGMNSSGLQLRTRTAKDILFTTNNNERMRIDSSGNVGIGTTSPSNNLDIAVGANSEGINIGGSGDFFSLIEYDANRSGADQAIGDIAFKWNGTRVARIIGGTGTDTTNKDDGALQFHTASAGSATEKVRIDGSGNVGIGTSVPVSIAGYTGVTINNATNGGFVDLQDNGTTTFRLLTNGSVNNIETRTATPIVFLINTAERMRIDSSGRLLVGTTSAFGATASELLQVANSNGGKISLLRNDASIASGNEIGVITWYSADGNTQPTASISCFADGDHAANDKPGRLVFSTTADGASSPTERMRITEKGFIRHVSTENGLDIGTTQPAGTTYILMQGVRSRTGIAVGGAAVIRIYSNGNVENTNNSYGALSDIKLKENIVDANSQWEDIKQVQVRNYNLIEGETHTQIGVVAQEIETVSPGLVYESPDRDEEGNDLGTVTKSVNYSVLYMKAVKALQEAMDRIETLEAEVALLRSN